MARPRAASFDIQKALIQDAAASLFASKGFHNASMSELAAVCEISKPLLYHYYRDKEEILLDICNSYADQLLTISQSDATDMEDGERRLRALIMEFMKHYEHSRSRHIVLIQDVKFLSQEKREEVLDKHRFVINEFAKSVGKMYPQLDGTKLIKPITMLLFGMMNWTFTWMREDGPVTYEEIGQLATKFFISGLKTLFEDEGSSPLTEDLSVVS